jgi:hypothetical protein
MSRHAEPAGLPHTALAAAFLQALQRWTLKHRDDAGTRIVIPAGTVGAPELRQVVLALLAIRQNKAARKAPSC